MSTSPHKALVIAAMAAAAACSDDRAPSTPGTTVTTTVGDGDGDGDGDADIDAGNVDFAVVGRVCVVTDLRFPDQCDGADVGGIEIRDRDSTARTATRDDGTFTLALSITANVVLEIGRDDARLHPATRRVRLGTGGAQDVVLAVAGADSWSQLVTATVGAEPGGSGAIAIQLTRDDAPAAGVLITPPEQSVIQPYYDDGAALSWIQGAGSGADGAALVFGVPTLDDEAVLTAVGSGGSPIVTESVPIAAGLTTFVAIDLSE